MKKIFKLIWKAIVWLFALIFTSSVIAATVDKPNKDGFYHEDYYNMKYCNMLGGEFDSRHKVTGATNVRVDCETSEYAYEGEWATKSYEAVGQSLWYALVTGKKPGILFYLKSPKHTKYVERAKRTLDSLGIDYDMKVYEVYKEKK